ncbi:MAG: hypothetical protein A2087_09380 [Spirochaetes bacterium GWD1_61_31]|nr:MAG: hypothetical protein A2Y37_13925 [Spirochaetes bacterium GWB1_60_80]OHD28441.1 MAG: hypothetical protein A2004_08125 [Spirochaetes bacterium GWC1_61_12]OHD40291.1 MAG: hypothetical protein A2087_09380 [Spirochaetes bacterium GWD1_61_31]OHD44840.1 MAG: hypothetical protein A2Y35_00490 [Spirochaetes bacterium GWE1_60_18]OHD59954.1 MAG: hypothetical protein A2Y32_04745 [Spirochaetes bacterium GWF1_60_12]HAP44062.1 hypothetical protein [Spirochaetaceae bacterium]
MRTIKKALFFLALGSLSLILAACYGPPIDVRATWLGRRIVRLLDGSNRPIAGLVVESVDQARHLGQTDANGEILLDTELNMPVDGTFLALDVDGPANGGDFADLSLVIQPGDDDEINAYPTAKNAN